MRVEVRKSAGATCPVCDSYQFISVLRSLDKEPEPLVRDLHILLPRPPWWRPFKHAWWREVADLLDNLEGELLDATRFPIAPTEKELEPVIDRS